jgi:hypothetical protein
MLYPKREAINKESNFVSSFRPPCSVTVPLAINPLLTLKLSTIYGYFRAVTNSTKSREQSPGDSDLVNLQNLHSNHGLTPQIASQMVSITFGNPGTVLGTTWNQVP